MARVQAFSSVSVVDLTDVGTINLYCTSNQPLSVIYNPNQSLYTPDWSSSNLQITPVISYNGNNLSLTATGLTITYTRKEGSGTATALTTGETVDNSTKALIVNANKLASVSSGLLTYICTIQYTDPNTGVPLNAEASLTYTLVRQATELKDADIIGETAFLYDADRNVVGTGIITLTADLTNVNVRQWQYQDSNGEFQAYPTTNNASITGNTLNVYASEANIWLNNKYAIIKIATNDNNVYDTIQIAKIYDGVAGSATVSAVLTNESFLLPVKSDGTVTSSSVWSAGATEIHIYEGGQDVTSSWTIQCANGTGLSGTYNSSTHTFTPSGLTQDSSNADFTCTRQGYNNISKRYTITKQYSGADGHDAVIYTVEPNYYAMNLSESGTFTPASITFNAYKKEGATLTKSNYSGRFIISETTDGSTYTAKYTSGSNEYTKVYTPSANTVTGIKCVLYAAGGTATQLDEQSVIITKDGVTGQNGTNGTDGLSMGLGNYSDVIPCTTGGVASAAKNITIPFYAYKGIDRVAVTATVGTLPTGVTIKSNTAGTTSASGQLVLTVADGATFGNASLMTGDITITLTAQSKSVAQKYTWTKNNKAQDGQNGQDGKDAVLLQIYSEDGGVLINSSGTTTLKSLLTSGGSTVTATSYQWKKFSSGDYNNLTGKTSATLEVTPSMVDDLAFFKLEAVYDGKTYSAYYTVDDLVDELTAVCISTVSQFKNSQGYGAVYTRVYRAGTEVDPIKSTTFSVNPPATASSGDYYYKLNTTNKTCQLQRYNGSSWVNDNSQVDTYQYNYYRLDSNGNALDTTQPYKTDRCFYIDPSIIDGKMQFLVEVTDRTS